MACVRGLAAGARAPAGRTGDSTASMGTAAISARFCAPSCSTYVRLMAAYTRRSMTQSLQSAAASTVAARGALYSSASSPNALRV